MSTDIELFIRPDGDLLALYTDALDFRALAGELGGDLQIARAARVEPTEDGRWEADLGISGGPTLGPFDFHGEAIRQEVAWLREHRLGVTPWGPSASEGARLGE